MQKRQSTEREDHPGVTESETSGRYCRNYFLLSRFVPLLSSRRLMWNPTKGAKAGQRVPIHTQGLAGCTPPSPLGAEFHSNSRLEGHYHAVDTQKKVRDIST